MRILEEFWYGNIEPTEYDTTACKEYEEVLRLITKNEEKLLATMTDEQKELFSRYTDAVHEHQTMAECLLFQNSFKLGARLWLESFFPRLIEPLRTVRLPSALDSTSAVWLLGAKPPKMVSWQLSVRISAPSLP